MIPFDDLTLGMCASKTRTVTEEDVTLFAQVTGDENPVHLDEEWASNSRFKGRIAHGMLTAGYVSAVLGMELPGPGAIYIEQSLRFTEPVRFGDTIQAQVEVIHIDADRRRVRLRTTCTNQHGTDVLAGEALVLIPREAE